MEENIKTSFKNILKYIALFLTLQNNQKSPDVKGVVEQKQEETVKANPYLIVYQGVDNKNALELLKTKENVITKQSSLGEYVDEINGIKGGTDNKYWIFYVNGKMAEVGSDVYVTKSTDRIEWKFE